MNEADLRRMIGECCTDVLFEYNGKPSGVTAEVHEYVPTFQVWHGDAVREYDNVDTLMHDPFFSGKSMHDLMNEVEFWFA